VNSANGYFIWDYMSVCLFEINAVYLHFAWRYHSRSMKTILGDKSVSPTNKKEWDKEEFNRETSSVNIKTNY
jgi:hypothetical protein